MPVRRNAAEREFDVSQVCPPRQVRVPHLDFQHLHPDSFSHTPEVSVCVCIV